MSLRRKLLAFLHNRKKTAEYTELAYLESTGTQWIDTGLEFQPIKAVIRLCFNGEKATRQAMGFSSYNTTYFAKSSGGTFEVGGGITLNTTVNPYEWQEVEFTHNGIINPGICKLTVDGKTITRQAIILSQPSNFWLFNIPGYGTTLACHCKISSAKFYNANDELIADLIPVLDKDLVPCMYDKVSGTYLPNAGTGEFNWKLPNQLEYLESDGNQYLLTDYYPNQNTAVEVDYFPNPSSVFNCIYGTQSSVNTNRFYALISSINYKLQISSINRNAYYGLDGVGGLMYNGQGFTTSQIRVVLTVDNYNKLIRTVTDDGTVNYDMTTVDGLGKVDCVYPLVIFNCGTAGVVNQTNGYKGRIYSFKIWESDKLLHYLIPVFDENLNVCMYDLVSKTYLYNQGSGTFKGYFADGSQLVAYLESTGVEYIDAGVECTSDLKVKFKGSCSTVVNAACCGGIDLTNNPIYFRHHWSPHTASITAGGHYSLNYWCQKNSAFDASVNPPYTLGDIVEVMVDGYNGLATVNGVDYSFEPLEDGLTTGKNYGVFARIANTGAIQSRPCKFCYFKIYKKDELVRHLLPVVDSNNVACMYDLISKQYFVNQSSGSFTYGTVANLFNPSNPSYVAGYVSTNYGGNITASTLTDTFYIPCKPNTTYGVMRSSVKVSGQVWRAATVSETPYTGMLCPNYVGGLIDDLTLTITSGENDKYLMFSEGRTMATDDLTKFTVVEVESE